MIYIEYPEKFDTEINRLKAEYEGEIAKLQDEIKKLREENERKDLLIKHYIEQIKIAQNRQFGTSSERTESSEQPGIFNEAEIITDNDIPEPVQTQTERI